MEKVEDQVLEEQVCVEPETLREESTEHVNHAVVEGVDVRKQEQVLAQEDGGSSVDVAEEGGMQGGSADIGVEQSVTVESIVSDAPGVRIAQLTKEDPTLAVARTLADTITEGYHWKERLVTF